MAPPTCARGELRRRAVTAAIAIMQLSKWHHMSRLPTFLGVLTDERAERTSGRFAGDATVSWRPVADVRSGVPPTADHKDNRTSSRSASRNRFAYLAVLYDDPVVASNRTTRLLHATARNQTAKIH
jgi:hypothetical protein